MRQILNRMLFGSVPALAMAAACPAANAATFIESYTFSVTGADGPLPSQSGAFDLEFDSADATYIVLAAINYTLGGTPFTTAKAGADLLSGGTQVRIGGLEGGLNLIQSPGGPDFFLRFDKATQQTLNFDYFVGGNGAIPQANPVGVTVTKLVASPVPEPASWAMMIAGFGMVGAMMRRRSVRVALA